MEKKVTVIIPTYKRSQYLIRAINSVINQTYDNVEIIIVDDNDCNSSFRRENEIRLKPYIDSGQIIYLKHEKNRNGAAARNTGLKKATGDYITFLDDDDFYFKDRIDILVNKLENNPGFDCAYSSMLKIKEMHIYNYRKAIKNGNLLNDVIRQNSFFGTGSNMFFTKKGIQITGLFDESFLRFQDLEYMVRYFAKNLKIISVDKILVTKCEEDRLNFPIYKKLKESKEQFISKFDKLISENNQNDILYNIYKELYLFSEGSNHKEAKNILKMYGKIQLKDKCLYTFNTLTNKSKIFMSINYMLREIRSFRKYSKCEKEEIFDNL